jgi:hypothetical protein
MTDDIAGGAGGLAISAAAHTTAMTKTATMDFMGAILAFFSTNRPQLRVHSVPSASLRIKEHSGGLTTHDMRS